MLWLHPTMLALMIQLNACFYDEQASPRNLYPMMLNEAPNVGVSRLRAPTHGVGSVPCWAAVIQAVQGFQNGMFSLQHSHLHPPGRLVQVFA